MKKKTKMAEKNLVEETLVQIQNLENVINENAKEILASTMKGEISELVKESMKQEAEETNEQEELVVGDDEDTMDITNVDDMDDMDDAEDMDDMDMDDADDMDDMDMEDMDMDDMQGMLGNDTIDLTDKSDEELLKIFKLMSPEDEISITQDGDYIHLTDEDDEYLIQTESEEEQTETFESYDEENEELEESYDEENEESSEDNETIYEIEMSEEDDEEQYEGMGHMDNAMQESAKPKVGKGVKTGSASKFSYKKTKSGGFKEKMKQGTKGVGMGKAKFEFKEGSDISGAEKKMAGAFGKKKEETKEAARTLGMGSKFRKGGLPKPRAHSKANINIDESVLEELNMLRTKNEEYRKALNLFRDKLNEVATFNSNLAYATRLFTEHSTSKQEKINILRRFDSADTMKESKALYKTIKEELEGKTTSKPMNESIERVIESAPQSGSAVSLIENKTYENPQFLRMKDIMSKIIK
jgi:hypothetical protein